MRIDERQPELATTRRRTLGLGAAALCVMAGWPGVARAAHVVRSWPAAKPVPAFDLVDLDGARWNLAALGGRVVVLNFWATWCEPCRLEMPSLEAMAARRQKDGVVVAAVNYRETPEVVRRYLERHSFKVPVLLDLDGDAAMTWTPRVFPSTVLIGRDGRPVHTVLGELDWDGVDAQALLDPMISAPRRST
ncbi:MAG: TlpA disulfide reductase family protein [Caldimonas sp.]